MGVLLTIGLLSCSDGSLGLVGPAAGGLVFVRERNGNADLMRARLSDGRVTRITRTPEREERWPYWSSQTERVVFQVRSYQANLMTDLRFWDPRTGQETALTQSPRRDERWPTWSPTRHELAYAFKNPRGSSGIALYDTQTRRTRIIARAGRKDAFLRPAYAPEGLRLVAQRHSPDGGDDLWLLEAGRLPRRLTRDPARSDGKAQFARDGASLVFTNRPSQGGAGDLARLDLATGLVTPLASLPEADDHSGKLSPVRNELVFVSDRDGSRDIFLTEPPDGIPRNLTQSPDLQEGAPIWSPDGERIVILRFPRTATAVKPEEERPDPETAQIAVIDRSGHVLFETPGVMADWMPAWP
jgi:Tol biopolymer transport system component